MVSVDPTKGRTFGHVFSITFDTGLRGSGQPHLLGQRHRDDVLRTPGSDSLGPE